ncbi:branched-chain amino acid transport system permease protein [Jatrophihabitans sp. GAS493]|uniref:ABC transporter permease n=1 Tax=Jatrophihabitans sp. GAS493 TaxID=1907575 RepID=UPI000BB68537|nr:ABC transporter permease [Jatrophihabitans sp. GAS493]SOD74625.1 branched-chain amino acid transport system permease protein [Jatrophihabitans sp. GAS493]
MGTYLQFAVLGLGLGAIYVGLANGLVLVYRATGIINFAMGAIAMWGGYVYAQLRIDGKLVLPIGSIQLGNQPMTTAPAMAIGIASAVLVGILVHYLVFRPVRRAPALAQVVVSVALMITLQALVIIRFGSDTVQVPALMPDTTYIIFGAPIALAEILMAAVMVVLSALIWAYLRFTRAGVATRAASDNERAAILMGFSPDRLAGVALVLASALSTIGVILASPLTGINPTNYTLYVVPALAVMLVARMSSIVVATIAGLLLGALQSILTFMVTYTWWPKWAAAGIDQVVPFIIVMIILFAIGKRLPSRGSLQTMRLPDVTIPRIRPIPATIVVVVVGAGLALTNGVYRFGLTTSIVMMLLALSYVLITGYLGQISLAQAAFAGAAGFALSKVTTNWNWPFPLAILFSALVASALGVIVALPALRIRGAQLAIVTLAAALAIERFVFNNYSLTPAEGNPIADPHLFGINFSIRAGRDVSRLSFSIMVLVIAVIVVLFFVRIVSGDLGRAFLAVRANERAAASAGINVRFTKLIGFALSAFIAGVAGCLLGYGHGQLSAASFTVFVGLQVLAIAYLGGITSWGGAAVAGCLAPLGIVYTIINQIWDTGNIYALISGLALILTAIINPSGIAGETVRQIDWVRRWMSERSSHPPLSPPTEPVRTPVPAERSAAHVQH